MKAGPIGQIEAARRRAAVTSFFSNNPGPQKTTVVATAVGLKTPVTLHLLKAMAKDGLIDPVVSKKGTESTFQWKGQGNTPAVTAVPMTPPPTPPNTTPKKPKLQVAEKQINPARTKSPDEVELVLRGLLVVVGINPKTGRFRLTLEEDADETPRNAK